MVRRRLSLPFTHVKEENEVIADEEINNWKWKSYHEIDVKQNMGNSLDNYGGSADQLVIKKIVTYN